MLDLNSNVYQTYLLVGMLYESDHGTIPHRNLISPRKWEDHLTKEEITTINEAWSRFTYAESLLNENMLTDSRIERWENFLMVEDDENGEGPKKTGIWGKIKSGIGKGLKWISRKVAGKRSLEKGGSLFGLGKKSKAQQAEWAKLEQDQKELIDILKAATSKDYPNNRDVEEFKTQTMKAIGDAEAFIKTHEDPGVRAEMYKALKKWVSYLLDQKIGDHYKHFMENMSLAGALLLLEAEEEEALGTKKGSSESIKGLESKLLPTILKILGGAGLAVTAGILAAYPEILSPTSVKAITTEDTSTIQKAIDTKLPPVVVKERFLNDIVPEYFNGLKAQGVELAGDPGNNPKDLVLFFKEIGSGDEAKGAAEFFKKVNIANPGGSANSNYFLERLMGGKNINDAAFMPGARDLESSFDYEYGTVGANVGAAKGSFMERIGGAAGVPVSISGIIAKQLVNKAIKSVVTKMVAGGVLGAAGAATAAAVAGAVGVGGLLSGFAISRLREKSKKDSRAKFLDDLLGQIGDLEEKEKETAPTPPPTPPPEDEEAQAGQEDKKVEKLGQAEVAMIVDNVMKDLGTYMEEIDANYNPEVSKDKVEKLVNLLNDKGKLKFSEYNRDDKTINDIMSTAGKEKSKEKQDDVFLKNIPPAYKAIPNQWKRKQPDLSADISDILGDKILPMHMLALRRALSESLLKSIFKHARIICENIERNNLILERWNKLAGLIT